MSYLTKILTRFREKAISERDKGTDFERLSVIYFKNEPFYKDQYEEV